MSETCPLLLISIKKSENIITDPEKTWADCLKENCAWWYKGRREGGGPFIEMCSIKKIALG